MIELVVISRLLEYPDAALWQHQQELIEALQSSTHFTASQSQGVIDFLQQLTSQDLLDAQANYSELFDRGRATSLLLFEHVHGESRDRGQAMVDLLAQYARQGLDSTAASCRITCRCIWSIWRNCRRQKRWADCRTLRRSWRC
jgi:nitrate reductase delta subunit